MMVLREPGRPVGQARGILAERVVVSTPLDPFLPLKALASYSGLSVRKLRNHIAGEPRQKKGLDSAG